MTPDGDNDERDDESAPGDDTTARVTERGGSASGLGWGEPGSGQPPGDRITFDEGTTEEVSEGSRPEGTPPPPPGAPDAPSKPATPLTTEKGPIHPTPRTPPQRPTPTPPVTLRRASSPEAPAAPAPGSGSGSQRPAVTRSATGLDVPPDGGGKIDELKVQLRELAEKEAAAEEASARTPAERPTPSTGGAGGPAVGELAQQLAATQAQVAALAAQITTLSHRLSYDLERSSQTTAERLLRDIPEEIRARLGADLGPAIDDLTDQIETDRNTFTTALADVQRSIGPRLTSMGEIVDALPLSNVEVLSALQGIGTDLEDRFGRFATRVGDQLGALERATAAELTRLRTQVDDLRVATGRTSGGPEALERMAGQVERLVQSTPSSEEVVEALELVVSEHLEVLRDNLDTRVAALEPAMRQELETTRAESLAGMASAEEVLAERIEVLEATLAERMDLALADQVDAVDELVTDRHAQLLGAIRAEAGAAPAALTDNDTLEGVAAEVGELGQVLHASSTQIEELVAAVGALAEQVSAVQKQVTAVQAQVAERPEVELAGDPMAAVSEELKALRRRISLRLESPGEAAGLTAEQVAALAAQIADHLH